MAESERSPDPFEEIDDPTELLSRPLEPVPLFPPPSNEQDSPEHKKRQLPPGFGGVSSSSRPAASSRQTATVWRPPNTSTQNVASTSQFQDDSSSTDSSSAVVVPVFRPSSSIGTADSHGQRTELATHLSAQSRLPPQLLPFLEHIHLPMPPRTRSHRLFRLLLVDLSMTPPST